MDFEEKAFFYCFWFLQPMELLDQSPSLLLTLAARDQIISSRSSCCSVFAKILYLDVYLKVNYLIITSAHI